MNFSRTIDIHAPIEKVWSVMSDVERWNEWTSTVTSIKKINNGPLKVGTKVRIIQPKLPQSIWSIIK